MRGFVVVVSLASLVLVTSAGCGGAKDDGLFSSGGDSGSGGSSSLADAGGGGGDDTTGDATIGTGDDGGTVITPPSDAASGTGDANTGPTVTPCANADPSKGVISVSVDGTAYALGNSTWSRSGQNGDDFMKAVFGSQCDGQADLTAYDHVGTFDVTQRMVDAGAVEGPVITFQHPLGTTYVAGYDIAQACAPCGSGSITVSTWTTSGVTGTFDVNARKAGSGQTRHFTGSFSFHK